MHIFLLVIKWLLIIIIILVILTVLFLKFAPTFGGKPDSDSQSRIQSSPNFKGKTFVNLTQTHASTVFFSGVLKGESDQNGNMLWDFLFPPKGKNPSQPIKTIPLNLIPNPSDSKNNSLNASKAPSHGIANTTLKEGEFVWLVRSFYRTI
ncbi:hypothetical protein [Psychrobacter sp.]|uniref:hypothetical protein n=1 Tax=Psychrobacter sp. TaxID=56811 RepID=UPI0025EA804A|nr:hypothetical protein [Psychrobacter sp.]